MKTNWSHITTISREHRGRDYYIIYSGFSGPEEINELDEYMQTHNYVYFPRITRRWEQDGKWFCELREADSCD